jgi:hypothetical protein
MEATSVKPIQGAVLCFRESPCPHWSHVLHAKSQSSLPIFLGIIAKCHQILLTHCNDTIPFYSSISTAAGIKSRLPTMNAGLDFHIPAHGDTQGSLLHEGSGVAAGGGKFVIRTDLLYEAKGFGQFKPPASVGVAQGGKGEEGIGG